MAESYTLHVCGLTRVLPIIPISEELSIASFVLLGDAELASAAGWELARRLPPVDALITAEAKGIPLVYEIAKQLGLPRYVVARKSVKTYMHTPVVTPVHSITTEGEQLLCLDGSDAEAIRAKRVAIIDDVISTGQSLAAVEQLVSQADGQVVAKAAILAEGDAKERQDILYLEELPLFPRQA